MLKVGVDISAESRWDSRADAFLAEIDSPYHRHRLDVIKTLIPSMSEIHGKAIVDFGCGDGVLTRFVKSVRAAGSAIGIDINQTIIDGAKKRSDAMLLLSGKLRFIRGDVRTLADFDCDCLIAANVLAYLTMEEEELFYRTAAAKVKKGGDLVITHSNRLFDLFTFNAYTVDFFKSQFGVDPSVLIANTKSHRMSFSVRENPIIYADKLRQYGFEVMQMEFMNYHAQPPLISGDDPDDMQREREDTLNWPAKERWKLMFQCSMFGVRARKI